MSDVAWLGLHPFASRCEEADVALKVVTMAELRLRALLEALLFRSECDQRRRGVLGACVW
jgi:hypothetical protein